MVKEVKTLNEQGRSGTIGPVVFALLSGIVAKVGCWDGIRLSQITPDFISRLPTPARLCASGKTQRRVEKFLPRLRELFVFVTVTKELTAVFVTSIFTIFGLVRTPVGSGLTRGLKYFVNNLNKCFSRRLYYLGLQCFDSKMGQG